MVSSAKHFVLTTLLVLSLAITIAFADELEEVCPLDYVVIQFNDDVEHEDHQRQRVMQEEGIIPAIELIRQGGDYVEFIIYNSTAFEDIIPDQFFVTHQSGAFGADKCVMYEELGPINDVQSSSDIQRAHCIAGKYALVNIYARSTTSGPGSASIPRCCHDPYASTAADSNTVKFTYELSCTPSCDDPSPFTSSPTGFPTIVSTSDPTSAPTIAPSAVPTAAPTAAPTSTPTLLPTQPWIPRRSLQEEIIKDMMPPSSGKCSSHSVNTTYTFESSQAESNWDSKSAQFEEDVFLAKMQHIDDNVNRSWTIRFGQAGNIYSFVGPMGETVPPQDHNNAPWVDEVWQAVQPLGPNGDNDGNPNTNPYFIHEAGTYQRDGDLSSKPFYSPTIGSYCTDAEGECGFASWGQQAHVPTPWLSPLLYLNRYVNCGNGVFEYTTLRHNNVGSGVQFGYMNVPWGGTRSSVLKDIVLTNKNGQQQNVVYPLDGWGDGKSKPLKDTMGYTIFAEDLPKGAGPDHDKPYPLPNGLDLTISGRCRCEGSCNKPTQRFSCPLVNQPKNIGWNPNRGTPGLIVRLEGSNSGKSIVAGVRHWAGNGRIYFYWSEGLTLSKVRAALTPGKVNVFYYSPPASGKAEEDNLALAHVHGGQNGAGGYPRVRYGAAGRDYNVYTINDVPTIRAGSTYYYRQYFMMDAYTEMRSKGAQWAPEAIKATKGVGTIAGRVVKLFKSDSGTFGYVVGDDTCRVTEATLACEGKTTPQSNSKALFQIRCGDSYVVTDDLYYFSPAGPPYRSYVCDGMGDKRPEWTLLGYFPVGSCGAIQSDYQFASEYC